MFYKVFYNQGFCSLLGFGTVLKKNHNIRQMVLGIVTLLSCYTNLFFILASVSWSHRFRRMHASLP